MAVVDHVFNSTSFTTENNLPWWVVTGFVLAALAVFLIATWLLAKVAHRDIPRQRQRASIGFLVALIIAGFVDDGIKALVSLLFHSWSIWISIPVYVLSYVVLLTLVVLIVNRCPAKSRATIDQA